LIHLRNERRQTDAQKRLGTVAILVCRTN